MARIVMTGFEMGSRDIATVIDGNPTIIASSPRTGNFCAHTGESDGLLFSLGSPCSELFFRLGVKRYNSGWTPANIIGFAPGQTNTLNLCSDNVGSIYVVSGAPRGGTVLASVSGVLPKDVWCCLEGHLLFAGASGLVQLKVDGVDVLNASGLNLGSVPLYARIGHAAFSPYIDWMGMRQDVDDLAINDTTGSFNNSWIGRGGIYPAIPNGPGALTEFTPSAGSNWQCVDELPPNDDTDYVQSDVLDARDLYTTGGIAPTDGIISAVQWVSRAKLIEPGIGNLRRYVRHNAANYASSDKPTDATYRYLTDIMELAPDGSGWSVAKVNALQIGQQVG